MADARTWEERVAAWRASGQGAEDYCEGKGFSPGTLYRWSSRMRPPGPGEGAPQRAVSVQPREVGLVRVVREAVRAVAAPVPAGAVLVEVEGGLRVVVPPGADAATVRVVLEALGGGAGASR